MSSKSFLFDLLQFLVSMDCSLWVRWRPVGVCRPRLTFRVWNLKTLETIPQVSWPLRLPVREEWPCSFAESNGQSHHDTSSSLGCHSCWALGRVHQLWWQATNLPSSSNWPSSSTLRRAISLGFLLPRQRRTHHSASQSSLCRLWKESMLFCLCQVSLWSSIECSATVNVYGRPGDHLRCG